MAGPVTVGRVAKIIGKVIGWSIFAVLTLVVLVLATVFIGIRTKPGAKLVVRIGLGIAKNYLAAPITVGALKTNLWSGLELDDVELRDIDGEMAAQVDKLNVRFSLVPLLKSTLRISSVNVQGARVRVRNLHDGRINFAALMKPSKPTPPAPDSPASKFRVEIADVNVDLIGRFESPKSSGLPVIEGHIQLVGDVGIGGGNVKVGIGGLHVLLDKPAPVKLEAHGGLVVENGTVKFDDTQASIDTPGSALHAFVANPELRGKYHIDVDAKGPLTALDLKAALYTPSKPLKIEGQLQIGDTFGWRGHVYTRNLDPELLVVGAPHALVWLDAEGKSTKTGATFGVAHAQVEAEQNKVHVEGKATVGKSIVADGNVEIAAHDLSKLKGRGLPKLAGSVAGLAHVHYSPAGVVLDTDLTGKDLDVPGVKIRQVAVRAHTENLSGSIVVKARDVYAGALQLVDTRIQFNGDKKTFLLRVGASGNGGTSIDLALAGTPRYEAGPLPVGVSTLLNALEVDRNGERWRVEPGAVIAYDKIISVERLRARSARQSLAVDAHVDLAKKYVDANVHAVGLDLNRIVALATRADAVPHSKLDLSVQAKGPLSHPIADVALAGTITHNLAKPEEQLHAHLNAHLDATRLTTKADFDTTAGKIAIDASLPFITDPGALFASTAPLSLKVDAEVKSLLQLWDTIGWKPPPVLLPLEATMKLSLALAGSGKAPTLNVALDADGMRYGSMENAQLKTRVAFAKSKLETDVKLSLGTRTEPDGNGNDVVIQAGQLEMSATLPIVIARMLGAGSIFDKLGAQSPIKGQVKLNAIALASLPLGPLGVPALVDAGLLDGQIDLGGTVLAPTVHVALGAKGIKRGTIDDVGLNVGMESKARVTSASAVVSVKKSPLLVLKARAGTDVSAILAGADLKATPIDATVDFPNFDLASLAALVPGLAGKLGGQVVAKGTIATPTVSADLGIDSLAFGETRFDKFALLGSYTTDHIKASLAAHEPTGGTMNGRFALDAGSMNVGFDAKALAIDFDSNGDAIPVRRLKGTLDAHLTATGAMPNPTVNGTLMLTKTRLAVVADPREITDMVLKVSIQPGAVNLETLSGKLGPGRFDIIGSAKLAGLVPESVDVHVKTHELPVLQNPLSIAVDTKVDIHGEKKGNALTGTVKITNGSARLPSLTNVRALQDTGDLKDVVYVDAKARKKAAKKLKQEKEVEAGTALDIDIETKLPGPFHIRSDELQVDLKGDLSIRVHGPTVGIGGQVQALAGGRLEILGKRYEIDKIRVGFDGGPTINPQLDVKITRQLEQAVIAIEVTGSASLPKVSFAADPPIYSDSQIILAILGSDPGEQGSDAPLSDKVGGAVSGLVVGQIKNQLAPHLPIDVIKVDVGDSPEMTQTRLEVGKYIKNNVYVSYVHQFGQLLVGTRQLSANQGNVEYRFKRNYAVELTIGDAPEGKADLVWTLRY